MSVTANKIEYTDFIFEKKDGIYTLQKAAVAKVYVTKDKKEEILTFKFKKNFKCDGLSVPKCFNWFLPCWKDDNMTYNLAGVIHDALYGNKGFGILNRDESDAIFRGLLRESGMNRLHASTADFMLGLFACCHWGNDDLHSAKLVTCVEEPIEE